MVETFEQSVVDFGLLVDFREGTVECKIMSDGNDGVVDEL